MLQISIHAARVGCDYCCFFLSASGENFNPRSPSGLRPAWCSLKVKIKCVFQSTQPEWAATLRRDAESTYLFISIHAARVGCDNTVRRVCKQCGYFNPRSPSGLRLPSQPVNACLQAISIHAARVGCDLAQWLGMEEI